MDQFVVLHHKLPNDHPRDDHWDLMLQQGSILWTWALDALPEKQTTCQGIRLPDHDQKYLTYQGPISADRGAVIRVISGSFEWLSEWDSNGGTAELVFDEQKLVMTIQVLSDGKCLFHFD